MVYICFAVIVVKRVKTNLNLSFQWALMVKLRYISIAPPPPAKQPSVVPYFVRLLYCTGIN